MKIGWALKKRWLTCTSFGKLGTSDTGDVLECQIRGAWLVLWEL